MRKEQIEMLNNLIQKTKPQSKKTIDYDELGLYGEEYYELECYDDEEDDW